MSILFLGWRYLSIRMRVVTCVLVLGLVSETLCIATEYWSTHGPEEPLQHHRSGPRPREGLWTYIGYDHDPDKGFQGVYQSLAVVSLILMIGACCVNWLWIHRQYGKVAVVIFTFLSGLCFGACLGMWGYNHHRFGWKMGWSFWLAVASCLCQFFCAALTVAELCMNRPRETNEEIDMPYVSPRRLKSVTDEIEEEKCAALGT